MLKAFLTTLLLLASSAVADQSTVAKLNADFPWQGYWLPRLGKCWNDESGVKPMGLFADRIENYEAQCTVENVIKDSGHVSVRYHSDHVLSKSSRVYRPANPTKVDALDLLCTNSKGENYKQRMRIMLANKDHIVLFWSGGFGMPLKRCPPEPEAVFTENPDIGGYDEVPPL